MSFATVSGINGGLNSVVGGTNVSVLTKQGFYDFDFKESCRFATDTGDDLTVGYAYDEVTGTGTITKTASGVVTIDSGTIALTDRILVKNQTTGQENGIYTVTVVGTSEVALVLKRSLDCDSDTEVTSGMFVHVEEGTANADKNFALTTNSPTLGTDALVFTNILSNTQSALTFGIDDGDVPKCNGDVADDDFLRINGTEIEGRTGAQVLSDIGLTTADVASGVIDFNTTALASTAEAADGVLTYDYSAQTIKWHTLSSVCFLKGTKITLPNKSQINIEDLTLDGEVLTYNIDVISEIKNKNILCDIKYDKMNGRFSQSGIRNIWINPTDSYLVINNKLNITKEHIIHFKRDNMYYFKFAKYLQIGDELFTDKDNYESIESIKEVKGNINVYNFELDKDNTYFAENYLVHHYCKLCSGYSNII